MDDYQAKIFKAYEDYAAKIGVSLRASMGHPPEMVREALHKVILRMFSAKPSSKVRQSLEGADERQLLAYLHTAVRNSLLDDYRYYRRLSSIEESAANFATQMNLSPVAASLLERELSKLPRQTRTVLERRVEGKSPREIAQELGLKEGHVAVLYSRGIDQIRKRLRSVETESTMRRITE